MKIVVFHLPPCRSEPVQASLVFRTQFKIFWMKTGGLWLSHWLPSKLHCQGPEKYEKHHQNTQYESEYDNFHFGVEYPFKSLVLLIVMI